MITDARGALKWADHVDHSLFNICEDSSDSRHHVERRRASDLYYHRAQRVSNCSMSLYMSASLDQSAKIGPLVQSRLAAHVSRIPEKQASAQRINQKLRRRHQPRPLDGDWEGKGRG